VRAALKTQVGQSRRELWGGYRRSCGRRRPRRRAPTQYASGDAWYRARHGCHSSGDTARRSAGTASPRRYCGVRRAVTKQVLIGAPRRPELRARISRSPGRELRARQPRARPRVLILHGSGVVASATSASDRDRRRRLRRIARDHQFEIRAPSRSVSSASSAPSACAADVRVQVAVRSPHDRGRTDGARRGTIAAALLAACAGRRPVIANVIVSRSRRCCSGGRRLS